MNRLNRFLSLVAAAAILGGFGTALPVAAQQMAPMGVMYNSWQPGWDNRQYDHGHVMLGRVQSFTPYRLTVARRGGRVQLVYLKRGTVIRPLGATPAIGQRVALIGYYSGGSFVVNRVILRP